jgi:hypothetical protein
MATEKSSAPHAPPLTEEQDDTVEAHYSGLERLRPHACYEGVVFIGHMVEGDDGEEEIVRYRCKRCARREEEV